MNRIAYVFVFLQDFLPTMDSIFKIARFFGITSYGFTIAFSWSFILFLMLVTMEAFAIWKLVRVLTGYSTSEFGGIFFLHIC